MTIRGLLRPRRRRSSTRHRDDWANWWSAHDPEDFVWYQDTVHPDVRAAVERADLPHGIALDVGCGVSPSTTVLAQRFPLAVGFDLAPAAAAQARVRYGSSGACFAAGDATRLPVAGATAAFVLDQGCLHVLSAEGTASYMREIVRVLRPGGRFFVTAHTHFPRATRRAVFPAASAAARKGEKGLELLLTRVRSARSQPTGATRETLTAVLPPELVVDSVSEHRKISASGWELRHVHLVARRV